MNGLIWKRCARGTHLDDGPKNAGAKMKVNRKLFLISIAVAGSMVLSTFHIETAQAAGPIVLDGQFSDWTGQAHINDPTGDAQNDKTDIVDFYFATNPNDETAYFMAERLLGGPSEITYNLLIDANDDGDFSGK